MAYEIDKMVILKGLFDSLTLLGDLFPFPIAFCGFLVVVRPQFKPQPEQANP